MKIIKDDPKLEELVKDHRDWDEDGTMGRDPKTSSIELSTLPLF